MNNDDDKCGVFTGYKDDQCVLISDIMKIKDATAFGEDNITVELEMKTEGKEGSIYWTKLLSYHRVNEAVGKFRADVLRDIAALRQKLLNRQ